MEKLSNWVLEKWKEKGIKNLPDPVEEKTVDIVKYLNERTPEIAQSILETLHNLDDTAEEKELKTSIWKFKAADFTLPNEDDFTKPEELKGKRYRKRKGDLRKNSP